jgi:nitroreductase
MVPIHELIQERRSSRVIDPNRFVGKEKVMSLLESARWGPSCFNNQPWRFVVSTGDSLERVKETLSRGNAWAKHAPLIITVTSKPDLGCQKTGREYYPLDIGLAVENLLLQGIHLGLVVHPIAGFDEEKLKEALKIPDPYRVHTIIIVGYPGSLNEVDEALREREKEPRERKRLEEIVFWEEWENPAIPQE